MPRAPLKDEQITAFRERVVEVATHLFATEGYEAVTMRAIASQLGVSAMTPYRYFEDKEELFAALKTEVFRRFADRQADSIRNVEPRKRLNRLGRAYVGFALAEPDAYGIMFELRGQTKRAYRELESEQKRAFSYLRAAVEDAVEAGAMEGDALTLAHLAWARVHGIVSLHLAGKLNQGRSVGELVDAALEEKTR